MMAHPTRDQLGRLVRDTWLEWAHAQPNAKPSWLIGWDDLAPAEKEVDCMIGEALFALGEKMATIDLTTIKVPLSQTVEHAKLMHLVSTNFLKANGVIP